MCGTRGGFLGWWAGHVEVDRRRRRLGRQPGKTPDFYPQTSVVSSRFTRGRDAGAPDRLLLFCGSPLASPSVSWRKSVSVWRVALWRTVSLFGDVGERGERSARRVLKLMNVFFGVFRGGWCSACFRYRACLFLVSFFFKWKCDEEIRVLNYFNDSFNHNPQTSRFNEYLQNATLQF